MENLGRWIRSADVRAWIYNIAIALVALIAGYGIITAEHGGLILALVAAVLGMPVTLARVNTPTSGTSGTPTLPPAGEPPEDTLPPSAIGL